jgi:hypothetical protein
MPQTRYYNGYPSDAELTKLEGVVVVEIAPPSGANGSGSGAVALTGEFLDGAYNTPTEVFSQADIQSQYGLWGDYSNPGGSAFPPGVSPADWDGNGARQIMGKSYARLILCRADNHIGKATITVTYSSTSLYDAAHLPSFVIPAGVRITAFLAADVFATNSKITVLGTDYVQTGSYVYTATYSVDIRRVAGSDVTGLSTFAFYGTDGTSNTPTVVSPETLVLAVTAIADLSGVAGAVHAWDSTTADAAYAAALAAFMSANTPSNAVSVLWAARHDLSIAETLLATAAARASGSGGRPCIVLVSPIVGTTKSVYEAGSGVAVANPNCSRTDRVIFCAPAVQQQFPGMVQGKSSSTQPMTQDITVDGWVACVLSNLAEEFNPGCLQGAQWLAGIVGLESATTISGNTLTADDYAAFRRLGICAPIIDPSFGAMLQSGVTSVDPTYFSNIRNIARRRMTDMIGIDLSAALAPYVKAPATKTNMRAGEMACRIYLDNLLSTNNPDKQRIAAYSLDSKSGNTPALIAQGIITYILKCQTLASMDFIVLQAQVGETVVITEI